MATPILFTTIEAIRATVGLDAADIPDSLILDQNLKVRFMLDLDSWYPADYKADWNSSRFDPLDLDPDIVNITTPLKKGMMLSEYATWFGAYAIIESMLAIPQNVSNGKDSISRFKSIDLEAMLSRVLNRLSNTKYEITTLINPSYTTSVLGATKVISGTHNPITGV